MRSWRSAARERMLEEDETGYRDMCLRAYGALTNCALLPVKELTAGMVKVKLGVALGFFRAPDMVRLNDFIANMRPVSFKMGNCPDAKDERTCDLLRAKSCARFCPTWCGARTRRENNFTGRCADSAAGEGTARGLWSI